jgi:predicted enzyme related to lactoylglutathione lyase
VTVTGEPSYVELGVPDTERALRFYGALLDWPAPPAGGMQQVETPTLSIGIHGGDPEAHFEVFFAVEDLASALEQVVRLGGRVVREAQDAGSFGSYAECADDQGVRFGLRQPGSPEPTTPE